MFYTKIILPRLTAWIIPILLPPCHIYVLWWIYHKKKFPVDTVNCDCTCWDTIFKGSYEQDPLSYKHFYFNATKTSAKIWAILATGVILLYECVLYLNRLLCKKKLRWSMALLFCSSLFPHYYAWWTYLNYYNDGFYSQWNHQLFFTITEIISTITVLHLANTRKNITFRKLMILIGISLTHIITSSMDQFIVNVWKGQGAKHQVIRDFGLMLPDLFHVLLPILHFCMEFKRNRNFLFKKKLEFLMAILVIFTACQYASIL